MSKRFSGPRRSVRKPTTLLICVLLKFDLQRHLPLARNVIGERPKDAAGGPWTINATVRVRKICVIQEVEGLRAELHPNAFRDRERLEK